jgi:hypothetical protein
MKPGFNLWMQHILPARNVIATVFSDRKGGIHETRNHNTVRRILLGGDCIGQIRIKGMKCWHLVSTLPHDNAYLHTADYTCALLEHFKWGSWAPYTGAFLLTPWSESTSELYRSSNRRLSAKWLQTFCRERVPRGQCDGSLRPYSRFSRQEPLIFLSSSSSVVLTRLSGPRSRPTIFFLVVPGIEPEPPDL